MLGTLKIKVASARHLKCKLWVHGTSKSKEESTWYVSSKCLIGTLEIKVTSAGHFKNQARKARNYLICKFYWYVLPNGIMVIIIIITYYHFYNYHYHYYLCLSNGYSRIGIAIKFIQQGQKQKTLNISY